MAWSAVHTLHSHSQFVSSPLELCCRETAEDVEDVVAEAGGAEREAGVDGELLVEVDSCNTVGRRLEEKEEK